jgi:hypothetical protein
MSSSRRPRGLAAKRGIDHNVIIVEEPQTVMPGWVQISSDLHSYQGDRLPTPLSFAPYPRSRAHREIRRVFVDPTGINIS